MEINSISILISITNIILFFVYVVLFVKLFKFLRNYKKDFETINLKLEEILKKLK